MPNGLLCCAGLRVVLPARASVCVFMSVRERGHRFEDSPLASTRSVLCDRVNVLHD